MLKGYDILMYISTTVET